MLLLYGPVSPYADTLLNPTIGVRPPPPLSHGILSGIDGLMEPEEK